MNGCLVSFLKESWGLHGITQSACGRQWDCLFPVTPLELVWSLSYHLVCAHGLFSSSQQCSSAFPLPTPPSQVKSKGSCSQAVSVCCLVPCWQGWGTKLSAWAGCAFSKLRVLLVLACMPSFDHRYIITLCNQKISGNWKVFAFKLAFLFQLLCFLFRKLPWAKSLLGSGCFSSASFLHCCGLAARNRDARATRADCLLLERLWGGD